MNPPKVKIYFEDGTLLLQGNKPFFEKWEPCKYDQRVSLYRCPAYRYPQLILELIRQKIPYEDQARAYETRNFSLVISQEVRSYQREALKEWIDARAGYVVLPTGAGKSYLALKAIEKTNRDTLVVVPTLDLMHQWYSLISAFFGFPPGLIGGGYFEPKEITITTYDSAWIHLERLGNRFGMIIFDECHHLPGESYSLAATFSLAPFRMGLTATPERADGREALLEDLIGPCIYTKGIKDLTGFTLSEYEVRKVFVDLTPEEKDLYEKHRKVYRDFVKDNSISFGSPQGWNRFIIMSSRSTGGRKAFQAYLEQKKIVQTTLGKITFLDHLLEKHRLDKTIIFTNDNSTVHHISLNFLIPSLTHQTKIKERKEILEKFREGLYPAIVTSKVLNEGVDIPEANVGIVLSGSGSIREHVQRLGRILRKKEGKQAILYEVVTRGTSEEYTSQRRGQHEAYQ